MTLRDGLSVAWSGVLDLFAPARKTEALLEHLTLETLHNLAHQKDPVYAADIRAILPYRNRAVKALIYEMKYRCNARAFHLAAELVAEELIGSSEESIGTPLLIPVPMHEERRRQRGHNQTELLCKKVLRDGVAVQYAPQALVRVRGGTPQQKLHRKRRLSNMKNAMRADPRLVKSRICIVIDDVSTTGATLMECRRALRAAGARSVHLLALAG